MKGKIMTRNNIRLSSALPLIAIAATLGACNPTTKTDGNATDANTTVQAVPADETGKSEDAAEVAREMHNRMNDDQAMHDSMKGGAMADDHMDKMGPGGMNDPAMKGGNMKGMGDKSAPDAAPKDKSDPMPMNDM